MPVTVFIEQTLQVQIIPGNGEQDYSKCILLILEYFLMITSKYKFTKQYYFDNFNTTCR